MWPDQINSYFQNGFTTLLELAKCGESIISIVPTLIWTMGTAVLTHKVLGELFKRFLFRRVPLWEIILQDLLFIWMIIYSVHFWVLMVKVIKVFVDYCFDDMLSSAPWLFQGEEEVHPSPEEVVSRSIMKQWVIWMFSAMPLAAYFQTRPKPEPSHMMIWITANPWLRREMGPYGYYLHRPLSTHSRTLVSAIERAKTLRRAFSDSRLLVKVPRRRRRYSKSI